MFNQVTKDASKSPETPLTHPEAPSDSEDSKQPPTREGLYQPYAEPPSLSEPAYKPYSEKPTPHDAPYEPYKGI